MNQRQKRVGPHNRWMWVGLLVFLTAGCAGASKNRYDALSAEFTEAGRDRQIVSNTPADTLFEGAAPMDRGTLIRAVLSRNPNVESARQAWRAALAEYPGAKSLDDPMVAYSLAPLSIGSDDVSFGQVIGLSQALPWPGKRGLKGEVALAEAEAARENYHAARQHLALMASHLFDERYAIARSLELNEAHRQLVEDIKSAAEAQYEAGRAPQQEPLQAELELSHVLHQRVVLESRRSVAAAQINGLLHRRPELPLPPPPGNIEVPMQNLLNTEELQEEALERRPELRASRFEVLSRESSIDLVKRQYYPDFSVLTSYNSMWRAEDHRWMIGLSLNIPIQRGARRGDVDKAQARLLQAQSQLLTDTDNIRVDVERARQRAIEAQHVVRLYRERLLPAARAQIESAQIGYETGQNSFQALIDAERSLRTLEIQYEEALARLGQRYAELQRATGHIPGLPEEGGKP